MELNARQMRVLSAICDTFRTGTSDIPWPSELGVPAAIVESLSTLREADQKQFKVLLSAWDSRLVGGIGGGRGRRFSDLSQQRREKVMLSWCDSRLPQRRQAFQTLRKAVLFLFHSLPAVDGSPNPASASFGYPGPLGAPSNPPPRELSPLTITADTNLDCDVVVIGSGAGGGTAAAVLAESGLDVVVIEAGGYYSEADFDGDELSGYRKLYLDGAATASADQSIGLLAGACLGGGTVVNFTTSFATPETVRAEWAALGVPAFAEDQFGRSLEAVCSRLNVNTDHNKLSSRDALMQKGLETLGWHRDLMPRNVVGCDQGHVCGYCSYGCQLGAKKSTTKTWLQDAATSGARLIVDCPVERINLQSGRATGVTARTKSGFQVEVKSRAVVVAAGAVHTPAVLRRSGLSNPNIGRYLRLHPVTVAFGEFDDRVDPWTGAMQAAYSDQHHDLDGNGYGVKYETGPLHPSLAAAFLPWRGSAAHADLISRMPHLSLVGVLLRDFDSGEVRVGRDGRPVVHYGLSDYDTVHMRRGVEGAVQIMEAAGAKRIFTAHSSGVFYTPGKQRREDFMADCDRAGWGSGHLPLISFHIMGSARMGGSPTTSACTPDGTTWEVDNVVVADGSCFPTASGVNPMISIEATAHMNARHLASRLNATGG